jgi:hypothetical protein
MPTDTTPTPSPTDRSIPRRSFEDPGFQRLSRLLHSLTLTQDEADYLIAIIPGFVRR